MSCLCLLLTFLYGGLAGCEAGFTVVCWGGSRFLCGGRLFGGWCSFFGSSWLFSGWCGFFGSWGSLLGGRCSFFGSSWCLYRCSFFSNSGRLLSSSWGFGGSRCFD
jgi:hypothetical protein